MVLVVNFSAAKSNVELASTIATKADNLSFMEFMSIPIKVDATVIKLRMNFNVIEQ